MPLEELQTQLAWLISIRLRNHYEIIKKSLWAPSPNDQMTKSPLGSGSYCGQLPNVIK
jgi:hypothetical protein